MSLPPEQITLRRKRGAEALETLYIENEGQQGKRYRSAAHNGFFYTRIDGDPSSKDHESQSSQPQVSTSQIPIVRTTLADEDQKVVGPETLKDAPSRIPVNGNVLFQTLESNGETGAKGQLRPRAFRLARTGLNHALPSSVISGSIHKHRKKRKGEIPLFVEKTVLLREAKVKRQNLESFANHDHEQGQAVPVTIEEKRQGPQKRPIVTAAEKEWRSRNWANVQASRNVQEGEGNERSTVKKMIPLKYDPIDLAAQLSDFAMMEAQKPQIGPMTVNANVSKSVPPKANLKYPPKNPPDRSRKHQPDTAMTDVGNDGGAATEDSVDQDYVYDTFVRRPIILRPDDLDPGNHVKHNMNAETSGLLVIESEDEELWQAYGEDDDSEGEFPSDEDDENAEDYYGNDYPEDEVASDDEYGRSAYRYRKGGSDDEDYDAEAEAWSDDEDKFKRWK